MFKRHWNRRKSEDGSQRLLMRPAPPAAGRARAPLPLPGVSTAQARWFWEGRDPGPRRGDGPGGASVPTNGVFFVSGPVSFPAGPQGPVPTCPCQAPHAGPVWPLFMPVCGACSQRCPAWCTRRPGVHYRPPFPPGPLSFLPPEQQPRGTGPELKTRSACARTPFNLFVLHF